MHLVLVNWSARLLGVLLALLVSLECIQVILRYFLDIGLFWTVDVTALLLSALGWLGAAHLWITRSHITLAMFGTCTLVPKAWIQMLTDLLGLSGAVWLMPKILETIEIHNSMIMPALGVPAGIKYVAPAIGIFFIGVASLTNLIEDLKTSPFGDSK